MDLKELFQMQHELDSVIVTNLGMEEEFNSVECVDKRVFALKVEIGEFSNVVGWFKYWKKSHVMDRAKALEEHSDVVHLALSVANSRNYSKFIKVVRPELWEKVPLSRLFYYLMENNFDSSGKWLNAMEHIICIGLKLGFTEEEMIQAYKDKNAVNHGRQRDGY